MNNDDMRVAENIMKELHGRGWTCCTMADAKEIEEKRYKVIAICDTAEDLVDDMCNDWNVPGIVKRNIDIPGLIVELLADGAVKLLDTGKYVWIVR